MGSAPACSARRSRLVAGLLAAAMAAGPGCATRCTDEQGSDGSGSAWSLGSMNFGSGGGDPAVALAAVALLLGAVLVVGAVAAVIPDAKVCKGSCCRRPDGTHDSSLCACSDRCFCRR